MMIPLISYPSCRLRFRDTYWWFYWNEKCLKATSGRSVLHIFIIEKGLFNTNPSRGIMSWYTHSLSSSSEQSISRNPSRPIRMFVGFQRSERPDDRNDRKMLKNAMFRSFLVPIIRSGTRPNDRNDRMTGTTGIYLEIPLVIHNQSLFDYHSNDTIKFKSNYTIIKL